MIDSYDSSSTQVSTLRLAASAQRIENLGEILSIFICKSGNSKSLLKHFEIKIKGFYESLANVWPLAELAKCLAVNKRLESMLVDARMNSKQVSGPELIQVLDVLMHKNGTLKSLEYGNAFAMVSPTTSPRKELSSKFFPDSMDCI